MIHITDKRDCCGCNSCVQRCPKSCIRMREDDEGFLYPEVDESVCIDCGLCEKVCPVIHQARENRPIVVCAAKNKSEEIRYQSSSGGVFTALANEIIREGGVVFGAGFDENWEVKHDCTETVEGLSAFRGSKYVQSRIGDSFKKAEQFLKIGRTVLFSGTPCQIAGLKRFLRKEYDNLLTVDFICHGVPSPGVWREYLKEETIRLYDRKNRFLSHPYQKEEVCIESLPSTVTDPAFSVMLPRIICHNGISCQLLKLFGIVKTSNVPDFCYKAADRHHPDPFDLQQIIYIRDLLQLFFYFLEQLLHS